MSNMLSYTLKSFENLKSVNDLTLMISSCCSQAPEILYACLHVNGRNTAYRICCDEDLAVLEEICAGRPVSILYQSAPQVWQTPFKQPNTKLGPSFSGADFLIASMLGIEDGSDVEKGVDIKKIWKLNVSGNYSNLRLKCVEGDYAGVDGMIASNNNLFVAQVELQASSKSGWSSSLWRVFTSEKPFGPLLWIEFNVI